jgi:hypothetical protein
MIRDLQWAWLKPLIEAYRPRGTPPPQVLRGTISAILKRNRVPIRRLVQLSQLRDRI